MNATPAPERPRATTAHQRRGLLIAALAAPALFSGRRAFAADPTPFRAETVIDMARDLATRPPRDRRASLPQAYDRLDYDGYRRIRFRNERALWADGAGKFRLQPHHRGFLFKDKVELFEVADGQARPIGYDPGQFAFEGVDPPQAGEDFGFAGFKLTYPLNRADHFDELTSFLGASYFRALGRGQVYGLSARGLSIATAQPRGEEFPAFSAFWIEKPADDAASIVIHALLESPSLTGAYRFVVTPGDATVMETSVTLFPRADVPRFGVAPGTSMFMFGPNDRDGITDYRNAVHDSDGLLMMTGQQQQIWRPLSNPKTLQVSGFQDRKPRGFGLMQRRRRYEDFHDLEANYHRRPGLWVEPLDDWGEGEVQLVEIPTPSEIHDNIVAAWQPRQGLRNGEPATLRYRLHWLAEGPSQEGLVRFSDTRLGLEDEGRQLRFVLDTSRDPLPGRAIEPVVEKSAGEIADVALHPNPETGGMRLAIALRPGSEKLVELRARLMDGANAVSETWVYRWTA